MNEVLDLLIYGKQILTLKGGIRKGSSLAHLGIIEDGIVGIKNGKINLVEERSGKKFDAKYEIDASNELVMPGFIDSHTHLLFYGSREEEFELRIKGYSYNEIQNKGGGIWNTVKKQ
jgi:Imidazolonepropionase and related amidohydrolases